MILKFNHVYIFSPRPELQPFKLPPSSVDIFVAKAWPIPLHVVMPLYHVRQRWLCTGRNHHWPNVRFWAGPTAEVAMLRSNSWLGLKRPTGRVAPVCKRCACAWHPRVILVERNSYHLALSEVLWWWACRTPLRDRYRCCSPIPTAEMNKSDVQCRNTLGCLDQNFDCTVSRFFIVFSLKSVQTKQHQNDLYIKQVLNERLYQYLWGITLSLFHDFFNPRSW